MDPHSSDFIESAPEPRTQHGGFRRLALLLPLVAAVPISIAVLSQRNNAAAESAESIPPADLTPTSGLVSTTPEPVPTPTPESVPVAPEDPAPSKTGPSSETVERGELSKILAEAVREQAESAVSAKNEPDSKVIPNADAPEPIASSDSTPEAKPVTDDDDDNNAKQAKVVATVEKEKAKPIAVAPLENTPARPDRHLVKSGDTLYSLGKRYGVPPEAISAENGIGASGAIQKGQSLRIPDLNTSSQLASDQQRTGSPGAAPNSLKPVSGLPNWEDAAPVNPAIQTPIRLTPVHLADSRPEQPKPRQQHTTNNSHSPPFDSRYPHANGEFVPIPPKANPKQVVGSYNGALRPVSGNSNIQSSPPKNEARAIDQCIGYIVQPNDTLPSIAAGHSTTVGAVAGLNGGILRVSPGQLIVIPIHNIATNCAR